MTKVKKKYTQTLCIHWYTHDEMVWEANASQTPYSPFVNEWGISQTTSVWV